MPKREELASPVAEAIRKMSKEPETKKCADCEFYWEEKNWCNLNDTDTTQEDYCDEFARY